MTVKHHDVIAQVLRELSARPETDQLRDRRRVISVLSDRIPQAEREIRVLGMVFNDGAVEVLAKTSPDRIALEIDRLAARIDDKFGIRKELVLPALDAIAYGLGRGSLPSEHNPNLPTGEERAPPNIPAAPPGHRQPMPPSRSETSWVGISEPPLPSVQDMAPQSAVPSSVATPEVGDGTRGLGGWLIAALLWLLIILAIYGARGVSVAADVLHLVTYDPGYAPWPDPHDLALLKLPFAVAYGVIVAFTLYALWTFVQRSRRAPLRYIVWLCVVPAIELASRFFEYWADLWEAHRVMNFQGLGRRFFAFWTDPRFGPLEGVLPFLVIGAIVGTLYFVRSRRVKNTFVR